MQKKIEPQIYSRLTKLREVGENAIIEGTVENVEIDNKTFYMEFSHSCIVDVAKIVEGAKHLGLSKGDAQGKVKVWAYKPWWQYYKNR